MNKNDLYRAFNDVDDDILERSEETVGRRKVSTYLKWRALAACLALVVGLTGIAIAAEAREYNMAVEFFDENGLSTEGLSRKDVKEVYRDITTQHFTYGKTAEVIQRAVPGVEIFQKEPTPEELAALWNENVQNVATQRERVSYLVDVEERMDEALGVDVFEKSLLHCYWDGALVWTAEFPNFYVDGYTSVSGGLAVWGYNLTRSSEQPTYVWVAQVDDTGKVLWERQLDHGFQDEYVAAVLDNGDGTLAVISRGDFEYLCLSQYDLAGKELSFHKTQVGNQGIWNATHLGEGYLVQLGNKQEGETARLAKLDRDGNLIDNFTYEGENCDYYLTDMAEFGGQVYLSGYAVPKQTDEGGRHEIANILNYVFTKDNLQISSEELTPMVRENYTAVLLLCDPEGGEPETFYSVKGSLGGALNVDSEQLRWDVESITSTFFSPATSSFTIGGTCQLYRYTFDKHSTLIGQEDTGETVPYRR